MPKISSWLGAVLLSFIRAHLQAKPRLKRGNFEAHEPAGDRISGDRIELAARLGFGQGTSVYDSAVIIGRVTVGSNTWIGPNTLLDGSGGLDIGDSVTISAGVQIYSHRASASDAFPRREAKTSVGDGAYVGPNAVIAMGVRIGAGATVGAMSLVLADVAENLTVFGVPARPSPTGGSGKLES